MEGPGAVVRSVRRFIDHSVCQWMRKGLFSLRDAVAFYHDKSMQRLAALIGVWDLCILHEHHFSFFSLQIAWYSTFRYEISITLSRVEVWARPYRPLCCALTIDAYRSIQFLGFHRRMRGVSAVVKDLGVLLVLKRLWEGLWPRLGFSSLVHFESCLYFLSQMVLFLAKTEFCIISWDDSS